MSEFKGFGAIHEIFTDRDEKYKQEMDAYLGAGWSIVDIHQRSYRDPETDEEIKVSVYIMGNVNPQAVPPKWGDTPETSPK